MLTQIIMSAIILFGMDLAWIGFLSNGFYISNLKPLLRLSSDGKLQALPLPAILAYLGIAVGIVVFVLPRANGSVMSAFLFGALFGLATYAIFDFTNYSMLALWPLKVAIVDILWGAILCGTASAIAAKIFF